MPSRRTILGALGATAVSSVVGYRWLNRVTGYVQEKSVEVRYREDDRWHGESVITVALNLSAESDQPDLHWLHDDWEDRFETPHTPVVSDTLHEDLQREYETVRYVVGVCSPEWETDEDRIGCRNANVSRADFNRVQAHDRVKASYDSLGLSIHDVEGTWSFDER
ncbi:hypothetical protein C440_06122 [Haloferax mucosum ATCC BAA-1512]|uniref:Uncharacterized protein n=1 Tax=Haloferax mucosum ATCC BAA-1512 TaxID=662479 RepID=M0IIZ9_9EURY|nr:hypothetical protein [Haloferax mucosum]ELZ95843.1 hypothetical protein C440_06122 [Haloferax mucosum ATCC BAA-1512]